MEHDLDNEFLIFRHKIRHVEIHPPEDRWSQIQQTLSAAGESGNTGIKKKWLRVAVAAVFLGISFFAVNYFLSEEKTTRVATSQPGSGQSSFQKNESRKTDAITKKEFDKVSDKPASDPLIASQMPNKRGSLDVENRTKRYDNDRIQNAYSLSSVSPNATFLTDRYQIASAAGKKIRNSKGEIREDISLLDLPNSYFYITGPNGESVRVSSKFRNTIQYLHGNDNEEMLDIILRESQYWKNRFRTWKENVGHSTFVPSAENFMGIADLMDLLQEPENQ